MNLDPLDPRIAKLVALWRSTNHEAERASARAKVEAILASVGITFDRAVAQLNYEAVRAANPGNFLAGFDEYQEIQEPGHLARVKASREDKQRRWAERRAALIEQHGNPKAIIAPCGLEQLLLASVKPWRVAQKRPWHRWSESVDGWTSTWEKPPPRVQHAIMNAIPMPTTFAQARVEADYWRQRNEDIEHGLSEDGNGLGDYGLDLVALARWNMVRDLAERDMPVDNLIDLITRFRMYRAGQVDDVKTEDALLRDLETIAAAQGAVV